MVFVNGRFVTAGDALVSAFDAGLQHGVGLFETMLGICERGQAAGGKGTAPTTRVVHLHEHMTRLTHAARVLGLSDTMRRDALADAVERTLMKASEQSPDVERFRIRLTLTGGDLNMLARARQMTSDASAVEPASRQGGQLPTILIHAQPATIYPPEMFEQGVLVAIADLKLNPLNPFEGHKTLNYWPRLRALQLAAAQGAAEALVFQVTNHLAGGCVSNAFIVKDGVLVTPWAQGEREALEANEREAIELGMPVEPAAQQQKRPTLASPVLAGITRQWVIDWAEGEGIAVRRAMIAIDDVLQADEVMLTNSSWGVLPVRRVEGAQVRDGRVGEVGKALVDAWRGLLESA